MSTAELRNAFTKLIFYLWYDYLYRFSMSHIFLGLLYANAKSIVTWLSFGSVHLIIKSMA